MGWLSLLAQLIASITVFSLSLPLFVTLCGVIVPSRGRDYFLQSKEFGDLTRAPNATASADW